MIKILLVLLITLSISGCGVNTSSSGFDSTSNGSDTNDTNDSNGSGDTNSSDGDNGDNGDNGDTPSDTGDGTSDIFVTDGAVYDSKACVIDDDYGIILDSSLDPSSTGIDGEGLEIGSFLDFSVEVDKTQVAMYYPDFVLTPEGKKTSVFEDEYWFGFDNLWVFNGMNTIYVRTPKNSSGLFTCYRYKLDSVNSDDLTRVKVYR